MEPDPVALAANRTALIKTVVEEHRPVRSAIALLTYITIWISSIASPFVFVLAAWYRWSVVVVSLLTIFAVAHSPLLTRLKRALQRPWTFRWLQR